MDLDLTQARLQIEEDAARMLRDWLRVRVLYLLNGEVQKTMGAGKTPGDNLIKAVNWMALDFQKARRNPGGWSDESRRQLDQFHAEVAERYRGRNVPPAQVPETVFDPGERYARRGRNPRPTIAAGEEVFSEIIDKAYQQGLKEAASALLRDQNPPREYQHYTRRKLRILARQNVKLVDATTRRMVNHITSHGRPDNADELLQKLYSVSRCQGIAIDQVSKGYIRGAAEVLRQAGYRYIYWRTMMDERVCPVCGPRESMPFTILEFLKQAPPHPKCRCYPSTTRFDGTRDQGLHSKSMLADWRQTVMSRRLRA